MRLPKYKSGSTSRPALSHWGLLAIVGVAILGLALQAAGQRRTRSGSATGYDDIVFATAFSPDGRLLAIARGASDPVYRFGRIELWDTATGKLHHLIKGFDGPAQSISFSPDGLTLISASIEFRSPKIRQRARSREGESFGELKWWDTRTGELKKKLTLPGEGSVAIHATQSPDGKLLALLETFWDQSRYFYDPLFEALTPTYGERVFFRGTALPRSLLRREMRLVDAHTGERGFKLDQDHPGASRFSPDGSLLAVANGKEVRLWNTHTGKEVSKLKNLMGTAGAVAFSPNGRHLAVASTKFEREYTEHLIKIVGLSEVKLFDVATGKAILRLNDVGAVKTLAFGLDGRVLLVGGVMPENKREAAGMKIFDLKTGRVDALPTGRDYREAVDSLQVSPNASLIAFRAGTATVKLLDTQRGIVKQTWDADSVGDAVERPTSRFLLSVTRMLAVAFSPDGTTVSGETEQGEIKSWDPRTGELKRRVNVDQDDPSLIAAATDGRSFAEVSEGKVLFWRAGSETKITVPFAGEGTTTGLALSADGRTVAIASRNAVTLLSPHGEVTMRLAVQEGVVNRLAFSHDGRWLAGADQFGNVRIWNVGTGGVEKAVSTAAETTAMVFAPHGRRLATAALDNSISIWNLNTGLPEAKFEKHDATINALAFSPNGQWLASGSDDRTIVLWDVAAGKSKRTFKGHDQTVAALAFSPDGRLLASGSGNASVVLWEVGSGKLSRVLQ
ncbi:MAG TPA: WD40 repeat domain-containing protein [Pyrinomonadaceae bacterium]|nr:WD40 repeat domain-containing protein [Pyrinomonadaceae bacterium]